MIDPLRAGVRLAGTTVRRATALVTLPWTLRSSSRRPAPAPENRRRQHRSSTHRGGGRSRGGSLHGGDWGVHAVRRAQFELPGGPNAPGEARGAVNQQLEEVLDPEALDAALVLVSELVMNSVLHAGADELHPIVIHLAVAPERVRVEVCDEGPGFDPDEEPRPRGERGGFGMLLLRRMANLWGVDTDARQTCVWFELERGTRAAPEASRRA